jgi:hypothetical protein
VRNGGAFLTLLNARRHYLDVAELVMELTMELIMELVTELVMGLVITLGTLLITELARDEDTRLDAELVLFAQADTVAHIAATTAI